MQKTFPSSGVKQVLEKNCTWQNALGYNSAVPCNRISF